MRLKRVSWCRLGGQPTLRRSPGWAAGEHRSAPAGCSGESRVLERDGSIEVHAVQQHAAAHQPVGINPLHAARGCLFRSGCQSPLGTTRGRSFCSAPSAHGPLDAALRNYILLITILVAFLEATAIQLEPIQPPVVMRFTAITKFNGGQP